ncbi:MAG: TolC family protein [Bacteriovoracaceae bacterium]|nr:TolC family protein [Bacteriovoracaceae bacterium]
MSTALQAEALKSTRLSLQEAISSALASNLELKAFKHIINEQYLDVKIIKAHFKPQFESTFGVGPISKISGDALESTQDFNQWGTIFLGSIKFMWPMYAWRRKKNLIQAVIQGVDVKKADKRAKELEIIYKIKEAYYGALYALTMLDFVEGVEEDLQMVVDELKKNKSPKEDIYRMEIMRAMLEGEKVKINKGYDLAITGLTTYVGLSDVTNVVPSQKWLTYVHKKLEPVDHYWKLTQRVHVDLKRVNAGIRAKQYLAQAEKKGQYPVIGIFGSYDFTSSRMSQKQTSKFAYDPYNNNEFAIGVGIKWDFDWGISKAKAEKLHAKRLELETMRNYALKSGPALVKKFWLDVDEASKKVKHTKKAFKYGKKWFRRIASNVGLGLLNARDLVDAYEARALTLKNYYESIYNYHMAWARFSKNLGVEVD